MIFINLELLKKVLSMSLINSIIITTLVQKIKNYFVIKCSNSCIMISFVVSIVLSTLLSLSFSDLNFFYSLWSGIFSFLGADALYQILEHKIIKSLGDIRQNEQ